MPFWNILNTSPNISIHQVSIAPTDPLRFSGLFHHNSLDRSFPKAGGLLSFYYYYICITEIPVLNANHVDPDQVPQSSASDLDLHCLLIALLGFYD